MPFNTLAICFTCTTIYAHITTEAATPENTHILQTGAVLVLVEVVTLPEAQQVVEVVEQAARVLLGVLLLPQGVEVERQLGLSFGQHQDHQTGVQAADVLLQGQQVWNEVGVEVGEKPQRNGNRTCVSVCTLMMLMSLNRKDSRLSTLAM